MSAPYRCPICDGEGKIVPPEAVGQTSTTGGPQPVTCYACGGKGVVWEPRPVRLYDDAGDYTVVQPVYRYDVRGV